MSEGCNTKGTQRYFWTGNPVGLMNLVGLLNFVSGGEPGTGLASGTTTPIVYPNASSRAPWTSANAKMDQALLDASFPYMELNWVCDLELDGVAHRFSSKNIYVEDDDGTPRFYEARVARPPQISVTVGEWLSANFQVGDISITINNRDGRFNDLLPNSQGNTSWTGAMVKIRVGFGEKNQNYFDLFTGFITDKKGVESTGEDVIIRCYDKFDKDQVTIPALVYDTATFPTMDKNFKGKPIPYVYGDWSVEVGSYGEIPAACTNAQDEEPTEYLFYISNNSLTSIGDIYLHRGDRVVDKPGGPIKFKTSEVEKNTINGTFTVPATGEVLEDFFDLISKDAAGDGAGFELVQSSGAINYVLKKVKIGDTVTNLTTQEKAIVTGVSSTTLLCAGSGVMFAADQDYAVSTKQYSFIEGDKVSLFCVGKDIKNMSTNRLTDAGLALAQPASLAVTTVGTYLFADNSTQKIYELDFENNVVRTIDYADIDVSITNVSGVTWQVDNSLWIFDKTLSKIFRFDLTSLALGLNFTTAQVDGLGSLLGDGRGLAIDEFNVLYIVDNSTGTFYKFDPFAPLQPTLIATWNVSIFDSTALDIQDLDIDTAEHHIIVLDRATSQVYRIDSSDGTEAVAPFSLEEISEDVTFATGIAFSKDGTLFIIDRATGSIYNYNEFADANFNPGFQARDIIQKFAGKVTSDFDVRWNAESRTNLAQYRSRIYLADKSTAVSFVSQFLQQFNTSLYVYFQKYSIFQVSFDNFRTGGAYVREGDIKMGSFNPSKEYSQYFNSATVEYAKLPFTGKQTVSDTYISVTGIAAADGKEVNRKFNFPNVYRRTEVDKLMPLFVRLSAAEPEFVSLTVGFRHLFTQLNDFYNINFHPTVMPDGTVRDAGRRFENVPCFVRKIEYDLQTMSLKLKLWSLGSTRFGDYVPEGAIAGGEFDSIVLTTLGTPGYVSPIGRITAATTSSITLATVGGQNAQQREDEIVGKAWKAGFAIAVVNATDHSVAAVKTILSVTGSIVALTDNMLFTPTASSLNAAGFIGSGHYIRYANYSDVAADQKVQFAFFGKPTSGYPTTPSAESEEQKSGLHNFPDGRLPYLLHPVDFVPA